MGKQIEYNFCFSLLANTVFLINEYDQNSCVNCFYLYQAYDSQEIMVETTTIDKCNFMLYFLTDIRHVLRLVYFDNAISSQDDSSRCRE